MVFHTGHPLSDLANMCGAYYLPAAQGHASGDAKPGHLRGLMGLDFEDHGIPDEVGLVQLYRRGSMGRVHIGLPSGAQSAAHAQQSATQAPTAAEAAHAQKVPFVPWSFCMAVYFFKYAVIAQGIAARSASGTASSPTAHLAKQYVPLLASMCQSKIEELAHESTAFNSNAKL